jgi:hypothetical protein
MGNRIALPFLVSSRAGLLSPSAMQRVVGQWTSNDQYLTNRGARNRHTHLFKCSALLGISTMLHSDDYITPFVPFFDIPASIGNLFQRIASI